MGKSALLEVIRLEYNGLKWRNFVFHCWLPRKGKATLCLSLSFPGLASPSTYVEKTNIYKAFLKSQGQKAPWKY